MDSLSIKTLTRRLVLPSTSRAAFRGWKRSRLSKFPKIDHRSPTVAASEGARNADRQATVNQLDDRRTERRQSIAFAWVFSNHPLRPSFRPSVRGKTQFWSSIDKSYITFILITVGRRAGENERTNEKTRRKRVQSKSARSDFMTLKNGKELRVTAKVRIS